MVLRSGAQPGDLIFVTGTLGDSALGLKLRRQPADAIQWQLGTDAADHLARRYLRPEPRLKLRLALLGHASAAMDISDGLLKDLGRMCVASHVGARVDRTKLPLSPAARAVVMADPAHYAAVVSGGDDYEILCAVPSAKAQAFIAAAAACGVSVTCIGPVCVDHGVVLEGPNGVPIKLESLGWDHF